MKLLIFLSVLSLSIPVFAQRVELNDDPQVVEVGGESPAPRHQPTGKGAAQKFFSKESKSTESTSHSTYGSDDHLLMVGVGAFVNSKSYKWGPKYSDDDPGEFNMNVSYRFGEWVNSMDYMVRVEYQTFDVEANTDPKKLSILPMIIFPDARSGFPLYFGAGAGVGIFVSQPDNESSLSLDYQIVVGGRFFNLLDSAGLFFETGIKNHVHLLSSGQFNGVFITVGSVFTF